MCQLLCGCKGRCYLGPPPSVVAQTDTDSADGVAGKESDGEMVLDASGGRAGSDGIELVDISGRGDLDCCGWLSSDFDSDDVSATGTDFVSDNFMWEAVYWPDEMDEVDM